MVGFILFVTEITLTLFGTRDQVLEFIPIVILLSSTLLSPASRFASSPSHS